MSDRAWSAYQDKLGNLTTREEHMIERAFRSGHAEGLEEAAHLCEQVPGDPKHGDFFAKVIRALKDKRGE
jgi:hypothetical protein